MNRDAEQIAAFLQLDRLEQPERFPAWLCAITANACRNWLRKPRETVGLEDTDLEEKMNARSPLPERPDEGLERAENRRMVSRALSRLSPQNRQILTLYYMGNRSSADIARYLDISPAAARQRLTRARGHLKEEILEMIDDVLKEETLGGSFDDEVQGLLDQASEFFGRTEYGKELQAAVEQFEEGIRCLEAKPPKYLREFGRSLFGERLCRFPDQQDDRLANMLQNHTWLAGLHAKDGDLEAARHHLRTAIDYLDRKDLKQIRPLMLQDLLRQIDRNFPELADEPEIQSLRGD